jgi:tocopherol cyclase
VLQSLLAAYRRTGADPPFGDPVRAHGVGMEGYYWRLTDHAAGRVVVAICGVARAADGAWAMVILAAHPGGFVRVGTTRTAVADPARLGVRAEEALVADAERLRVDLGPDARLDVALREAVPWPRRAFGALGVAQALPGLHQYWHPHLLGGRAVGWARLGDEEVEVDAAAYAEKNWGAAFSEHWWWGQAFPEPGACVAFAGGRIRLGPLGTAPTAVVVRVGTELVRLSPPGAHMAAAASDGAWRIRGRSPRYAVLIEGEAAGTPAASLPVPVPAERALEPRSRQILAGRLEVTLRRGRRVLYRGSSALAGLEHGTAQRSAASASATVSGLL